MMPNPTIAKSAKILQQYYLKKKNEIDFVYLREVNVIFFGDYFSTIVKLTVRSIKQIIIHSSKY